MICLILLFYLTVGTDFCGRLGKILLIDFTHKSRDKPILDKIAKSNINIGKGKK